ncbi:hypothetical protein B0A52_10163 [Exophiala mesophila]|uniref:Uncharacterized protein n=1 Tax=Exophiala mesophila TaxID=212818 RepID=A0A438MRH3_EXOME|nr:hypothetical protein B0A52_10163 [Exophiala mesophila]
MGCGSSSLKGEDVNVNGLQPSSSDPLAPRRVRTDFASVDYDQDGNNGRRMTEYAPHETVRSQSGAGHDRNLSPAGLPSEPKKTSKSAATGLHDSLHADSAANPKLGAETDVFPHEGIGAGESKLKDRDEPDLKPYQTIDNDGWDRDEFQNQTQSPSSHAVNGTHHDSGFDPLSTKAKEDFAHDNDPANTGNQANGDKSGPGSDSAPSPRGSKDGKKSWLGDKYSQYQAMKSGRNQQISDEELKKYTGMDRKQLKDWGDARDGVAGNQRAGTVSSSNAKAAGAAWDAAL